MIEEALCGLPSQPRRRSPDPAAIRLLDAWLVQTDGAVPNLQPRPGALNQLQSGRLSSSGAPPFGHFSLAPTSGTNASAG
jgi:hypothetical protein